MMAWLNKLVWLLGGNQYAANIVIVGVANSGKSTIMHQLKPREVEMVRLEPTIPVCHPAEKFQTKSLTFVAFDLGEEDGFGNPWEEFYKDAHGIIFVVDSTDRFIIPLVIKQLEKMLNHPLVKKKKNVPLLFLANKCDNTSAMQTYQLSEALKLKATVKMQWNMFETDALTGEGFNEALDWFAHMLRRTCRT